MIHDDVIIAQCTASGKGALALLRLCGQKVRQLVSNFAHIHNKDLLIVPSGTVHYGCIKDKDTLIDQVLVIVMDGPKTFTGENTIEITCHNNPFIIQAIIALAIKYGARLAQEGEFTKLAYLNNKIDLLQAESINELISANTQIALKSSIAQLSGTLSHFISNIERDLIRALSWCEATFDFLDDQTDQSSFSETIKEQITAILKSIESLKQNFNLQQQIRNGVRIAIIGSVNAGKSSLFNALLNNNRAIVTDIAGTTRDTIEAGLCKNGNYWTLIDTAGLRETGDIIEAEGIKKSFNEAASSDIILLVFDRSRNLTEQEKQVYSNLLAKFGNKIICVKNKSDLPEQDKLALENHTVISISASTKNNLNFLEQAIEAKLLTLFAQLDCPYLLNTRQHNLLLALEQKLLKISAQLSDSVQYELVSYNLKDAIETLSELTGKTISEAALDTVFKEFCVGK